MLASINWLSLPSGEVIGFKALKLLAGVLQVRPLVFRIGHFHMEVVMAFYVIEAVHFNSAGERIEKVRWGKVKGGEVHPLFAHFEPEEEDVISVVNALHAGDDVCTAFPAPGGTVIGPYVKTVVYADGVEGIETLDQDSHPGRTLYDLPAF